MKNARFLAKFLIRAVVIGLAAGFLIVWWKPSLLGGPDAAPSVGIGPGAGSGPAFPSADSSAGAGEIAGSPGRNRPAGAAPTVVIDSFADAVARASPAVVNIYTARVVTEQTQAPPLAQLFGDFWPTYRQRVERSLGSGVIVNADGTIVTNQHVIAGAESIMVQLADGRVAEAKIVGQDPDTDLAVLHLPLGKLPAMPLGRSDKLRAGDIVLAIGNPYGLSQTVTQGIVSATGRGQLGLATFENFIQTDAAINPGNSGGALIDVRGELVGINTAVLNRAYGGPEGIGFAIPVNLVRGVVRQILEHGHVIRGWLGLSPQDLSDAQAAQLGVAGGGITVVNILVKSPAYEAGVRPGDLLTSLNGAPLANAQELVSRVAALKPGTIVSLGGRHGVRPFDYRFAVMERPTRTAQAPQ
ncbi:MAG: trypsin-like peptidase domain-containing protein [Gammaproteobacteria bacterium]|nr:trypsin-like peptidase domain-containing protein [Gammaproteobacteria bacterium]